MTYIYPVDDGLRYRASMSGFRAFIDRILHHPPITRTTGGIYTIPTPRADQFTEYESYGENWDGFGAERITSETIEAARQLSHLLPRQLRAPDVAPGADGTIGFEWREGPPDNRKIFIIEIGPGSLVVARIAHPNRHIENVSVSEIIASLLP